MKRQINKYQYIATVKYFSGSLKLEEPEHRKFELSGKQRRTIIKEAISICSKELLAVNKTGLLELTIVRILKDPYRNKREPERIFSASFSIENISWLNRKHGEEKK